MPIYTQYIKVLIKLVVLSSVQSVAELIEVSVASFSGIAEQDACNAFSKTIEAAREKNASVLRIPKGTYHFHWNICSQALIYVSNTVETPLPPKPIGLWLYGLSNLVVEGEGSLLLFHGKMTPIAVDHSRNVTVRNLSVDFPHPTVVEAQVLAATASSVDVKIHSSSNYTLTEVRLLFVLLKTEKRDSWVPVLLERWHYL